MPTDNDDIRNARRITDEEIVTMAKTAAARLYDARFWRDDTLIAKGTAIEVARAVGAVTTLGAIIHVHYEERRIDELVMSETGPARIGRCSDLTWIRAIDQVAPRRP